MATAPLSRSSNPLPKQSEAHFIGVACLDSTYHATHAVAKVIFNEARTKVNLYFSKDHIQCGWPSFITSSEYPFPRNPSTIRPGFHTQWTILTVPYLDNSVRLDRCSTYVEKATITFDSIKTYEHVLFHNTIMLACKTLFPNLERCFIKYPPP